MSLTWNGDTERLLASGSVGPDIALVRATGRQHVSVYRPTTGQWRLAILAPMDMPDELLMEMVRVHLTPDETVEVEQALTSKHWP